MGRWGGSGPFMILEFLEGALASVVAAGAFRLGGRGLYEVSARGCRVEVCLRFIR